jgi:hypothetical protein
MSFSLENGTQAHGTTLQFDATAPNCGADMPSTSTLMFTHTSHYTLLDLLHIALLGATALATVPRTVYASTDLLNGILLAATSHGRPMRR